MKNKAIIYSLSFIAFLVLLFLGANITGFIVYKTEYNDLCRADEDCFGKQCCILYPEKNLGVCMENCMSYEFLCKDSKECEEGTVCCRPEGKEYGICNKAEKCLNVDVFADYIGKTTFVDPIIMSRPETIPVTEKPLNVDSKSVIYIQTTLIILLLAVLIYFLLRKNKK